MKCLNCGKDFEAKRKTAKYCSSKCRVYASRGLTFKDKVNLSSEAEAREILAKHPEANSSKVLLERIEHLPKLEKWTGPVTKSFSARKKR